MSGAPGYKEQRARLAGLTPQEVRARHVVDSLFAPGALTLRAVEVDRAIVGAATPTVGALPLLADPSLKAAFFCERRELGVLNIGGAGRVAVDGQTFDLAAGDSLYIGRGARDVAFSSASVEHPARFHLVSYPAHAAYPHVRVGRDEARRVALGDRLTSNSRVIRQAIRPGIVESCQLVMGYTELDPGQVWNTMPPHTHLRRSEVYMYYDLAPARVLHLMGEPQDVRTFFVDEGDVVISPPWSIHSGVGTAAYSFCWAMGGENLDFNDMDPVGLAELA